MNQPTCSSLNLANYERTKAAVAEDPTQGYGTFAAETEWQGGALAVSRARSFAITTDEPTPLGGEDSAVDPMELLLASLGSCLTIGWVNQANFRGIDYRSLKIRVSAPYDLRGYLDLDPSVRPGFSELHYEVEVDSDADPEVLEEVRAAAEKNSPLFDNILRATPIHGRVA